ncbi:MAG: magnesium transporter MgtE N-terminal domain-containing protein [Halobacteriota archaeon]
MPFLSEMIKKPVVDNTGKVVGKLIDVIVSTDRPYPKVKALSVRTAKDTTIAIPWEQVKRLEKGMTLKVAASDVAAYQKEEHEVQLATDVLDRQVVDVEGKKLRRVNDLQLAPTNGSYRLIGVDIGVTGLLRRLGIERAAERVGIHPEENYIAWTDVDSIRSDPMSVKLTVPKYGITKLHPADIAEIVDQLNVQEGLTLINSLDEEAAADTLEETSEERQVSLIAGMDTERAADILEEMSPDDAADLLGDLPPDRADAILELMEPDESEDIKKLLEYPEDTAGGIMTNEFIAVNKEQTAQQALEEVRKAAKSVESIYYIYVTSNHDELVGVASLREILVAPADQRLSALMHTHLVTADVREDQHEVARKIAKYNLLALPVVEKESRLKGIVTVDDAIDIVLPTAWKKKVPKMFG